MNSHTNWLRTGIWPTLRPCLLTTLQRFLESLKTANHSPKLCKLLLSKGNRRSRNKRSKKITISSKAIDEFDRPEATSRFNPLNHELVPHQELLGEANISEQEQYDLEKEELLPWGLEELDEDGKPRLAKELLPKVLISDPVVQAIKEACEILDNATLAANPDHRPLAAGGLQTVFESKETFQICWYSCGLPAYCGG